MGVVSVEPSLSLRIQQVLQSSCEIVFAVTPTELDSDSQEVDLLIVAGALETGESSAIRSVQRLFPDTPVVACAPSEGARSIRRAIEGGVEGIVWESRLDETLNSTVLAVLTGQLVVPSDTRSSLSPPNLTNREKQTLSLILMGLTNQEIADKLFISESTVKSHLNSAYKKLGVHSRAEAIRRIADPNEGFGTGILAITGPGFARSRPRNQ